MTVTMTPTCHDDQFSLRPLLQLPVPLVAALLPWWCALVLALVALSDGRLWLAVALAATGLLYSAFVSAAVLYRMVSERA